MGWWQGRRVARSVLAMLGGVHGCASESVDHTRADQLARAEALVQAHCDAVAQCECSKTASSAGCAPTLDDAWRARIAAGTSRGLTYDETCFDTIEAGIADARCAWPPGDARNPCHDHCQLFHGERDEGQSCTRFDDLVSDCAQGLLCDGDRCVAPCSRLFGLPAGAKCRDTATSTELDRCAEGLTCIFSTGTCSKAPAAGEPCLEGECDGDSYCSYIEEPNNVCRPRAGVGEDCEYASCASGLRCVYQDEANGSYRARCMEAATEGMPCSDVGCADGLVCGGEPGVCKRPAGEGQSCLDRNCDEGLLCDFEVGVCREPPPAGSPCLFGECARGSFCELDVCVAGLALAEPCTGHRQCSSGFCPAGFCDDRPRVGESCADALVCDVGASCDGAVCRASVTRGPAVCVYEGW
jgi:hypothetical protein